MSELDLTRPLYIDSKGFATNDATEGSVARTKAMLDNVTIAVNQKDYDAGRRALAAIEKIKGVEMNPELKADNYDAFCSGMIEGHNALIRDLKSLIESEGL